jgi:FKBP-type peptidyl-prolyl cis-trans isomerase FklB
MKLKWMLLLSLVMVGSQAYAISQADANAANKERMLRGGKMSPREREEIDRAALADTNKRAGDDFLASNKAKPGVVSLPSGVQYKILRASEGKKPGNGSQINCRYKGTLIDGTSFDQFEDKKPSALHVAGLLPGLKEAVKLMPVGSKWEIVIPPKLAYGAQGNRVIGPNAVLIYEMEILSLK